MSLTLSGREPQPNVFHGIERIVSSLLSPAGHTSFPTLGAKSMEPSDNDPLDYVPWRATESIGDVADVRLSKLVNENMTLLVTIHPVNGRWLSPAFAFLENVKDASHPCNSIGPGKRCVIPLGAG